MAKRVMSLIMAVVLAMSMLMLMGCDNGRDKLKKKLDELILQNERLTAEKGELEDRLEESTLQNSELEAQLDALIEQNELTEEQLSDLQYKFEQLLDIDWFHDKIETFNLYVEIKPEYSDREYTVEDFLPIRLSYVRKIPGYLYLRFEEEGLLYIIDAVIKLYSFEFVERVEVLYVIHGAG